MKKQIRKFVVLALAVGMIATSVLGASAAFDPAYYAKQNPDVVKALGNSPEMLKLHYDMFGKKEARMSNKNDVEAQLRRLFNEKEYAKLYPDVKNAFGDNKELMFQHYIAFGLLEARRPSEKVSKAAAVSMKKTVEKAMKDAGLAATPGSLEVVAVITGETASVASAGGEAMQQALSKVAEVVAKEVTATVQEVNNPAPAAAPASSSPSSSSNSNSQQKTRTVGLTVYTNVTVDSSKLTDLGTATALVSATGSAAGNTVRGKMADDKEIAVATTNKIGNDYWYAIAVPKSDYNGDKGTVIQWVKMSGQWKNVTANPHSGVANKPANQYVFGLGVEITGAFPADGIEKYTAEIALAKAKEDDNDKIDENDPNIRYYQVDVRLLRGLTIKYYAATKDGSEDKVNAKVDGATELTYKSGNGTENSPFVFNSKVKVKKSSQVGSTYWVLIDTKTGTDKTGDIKSVTVKDVSDYGRYKYFTETFAGGDGKNLVGFGANDGTGEVIFSVDGVWFKLEMEKGDDWTESA